MYRAKFNFIIKVSSVVYFVCIKNKKQTIWKPWSIFYELLLHWGPPDREHQSQIHTVDDSTLTLPYANGSPVFDLSHESEDEDGFGILFIDECVATLRQWAVVYMSSSVSWYVEQAISDSLHNLTVTQPFSSHLRAMASMSVANPKRDSLFTEKFEMTQNPFD